VGVQDHCPVGYAFWSKVDNTLRVLRIGVKPDYRGRGIGTLLLQTVVIAARQKNIPKVVIPVPESLCCPGSQYDISQWLIWQNFRATEILKDAVTVCGTLEDVYLFTFNIKGT
jgi:GNAT superfamily N-acetyltransferase